MVSAGTRALAYQEMGTQQDLKLLFESFQSVFEHIVVNP